MAEEILFDVAANPDVAEQIAIIHCGMMARIAFGDFDERRRAWRRAWRAEGQPHPEPVLVPGMEPTQDQMPTIGWSLREDTVDVHQQYQDQLGQFAGVGFNDLERFAPLYPKVPEACIIGSVRSLDELAIVIAEYGDILGAITDDYELWDQTPEWEQQHPVETCQAFADACREAGLHSYWWMGVRMYDREPWKSALSEIALEGNPDLWGIQCGPFQDQQPPGDGFAALVADRIAPIREANPRIKIMATLYLDFPSRSSVSLLNALWISSAVSYDTSSNSMILGERAARSYSVAEIVEYATSIQDIVDGFYLFDAMVHRPEDLDKIIGGIS